MFSLSTIPGKMSLPMNGIKQPTKRKLKIFGLPLSTLLIGRELALLTFCSVLLMTIDFFHKNSNGDDRNEEVFFHSDDAIPAAGQDLVCGYETDIEHLMQDTTVDEIYACDIQWDTNQDLTTDRDLTDIDEVRNKFKDIKEKGDSNSHIRSKVSFKDFNTEKFQAHYIMVIDYRQYRNDSSKYYGNGIG